MRQRNADLLSFVSRAILLIMKNEKYECDNCGACCNGKLIVEAFDIDLMREPKLIEAEIKRPQLTAEELKAELEQEGKCILVACGEPCPFYDHELNCTIYPTRPNVCVAMQAGDEQCQHARKAMDLPPLEPTKVVDDSR